MLNSAGFAPLVRKVRTRHKNGPVSFAIDPHGARHNPVQKGSSSQIAVFGDSYAFCRLVNDKDTWPCQLSQLLGNNIRNFGVGNYGLDQACLRMNRELEKNSTQIAVMCIVPESMARIHSYWKHYFEYGNILSFKPRYTVENDSLVYHPQAVKSAEDFRNYRENLETIQHLDEFFHNKFLPDLIAFPVTWHLLRRWNRHIPILWHLAYGAMTNNRETARKKAFNVVIRNNAKATAKLYSSEPSKKLFSALVNHFSKTAHNFGAVPILVIVPQPIDLERQENGFDDYREFMNQISSNVHLIDLTETFLKQKEPGHLYIEGPLGPHVSTYGNQVIAESLAKILQPLLRGQKDNLNKSHEGYNSCA